MADSQLSLTIPEGAKSSYYVWVQNESIPVIETFFVEDIHKLQLQWCERSKFPMETDKNARHHGAGAHWITLRGEGYSLNWPGEVQSVSDNFDEALTKRGVQN